MFNCLMNFASYSKGRLVYNLLYCTVPVFFWFQCNTLINELAKFEDIPISFGLGETHL